MHSFKRFFKGRRCVELNQQQVRSRHSRIRKKCISPSIGRDPKQRVNNSTKPSTSQIGNNTTTPSITGFIGLSCPLQYRPLPLVRLPPPLPSVPLSTGLLMPPRSPTHCAPIIFAPLDPLPLPLTQFLSVKNTYCKNPSNSCYTWRNRCFVHGRALPWS